MSYFWWYLAENSPAKKNNIMKQTFVIAFPDGTYMDQDGKYSTFFFAKMFETHALAYSFACDNLELGVHFRIDTIHVQTIS